VDKSNVLSGIRDNRNRGTVGAFLRDSIRKDADLDIVSAYFTIYAYGQLKEQLDGINGLRFLFGEPKFVRSVDPDKTDKKAFHLEDNGVILSNRLEQKYIAKACADWIRRKVEIKSVRESNLLHGKMYHITNGGKEEAILGSSNFTVRGLGLGAANNIELNLVVDSDRDRRDLKAWFEELWEDTARVEDVKEDVLAYLDQLYANNAPEFIYYKTLFHIFEKFLLDQEDRDSRLLSTTLYDTDVWKALFEFQRDGVKGAINKIIRHNGCIVADSVGLGKTFEALAVIKYFELLNHRVLVLCPKKLKDNWTVYQAHNASEMNPFLRDRFSYTVLCHTDLSRDTGRSGDIDLATVNWGNFDLVVIDESHNFRNNTRGRRDEEGNVVSKSRYERLMEDVIKGGIKTKVLLLSATPVNNNLRDLRNQIYFITEGEDAAFQHTLGIPSITDTLAAAQKQFTSWAREQDAERNARALLERLSAAFFKILDELTIARSRAHIERYYAESVDALGGFPERRKPLALYPSIDTHERFMSYDKLNDEIGGYKLSLFNPSFYILLQYQEQYAKDQLVANFTQSQRENFLIGMMKVGFLKRLESSVHSFATTMERTLKKIEALEDRINRFKDFKKENPSLDFDELEPDDVDDEDIRDALQVGGKMTFNMNHLDLDRWLTDLKNDKQQLNSLYLQAKDITLERDAKLQVLKEMIGQKVASPTTNKLGKANRKVLLFTAFADTAEYLYDALKDWAVNDLKINIALVTGGGDCRTSFGRSDYNTILINFSPISKRRDKIPSMDQEGEIDLLIATDCISEGQNLQDCDYLINYDIHWNPVRIIQRFGRIDRIGSVNESVQLVNFWPTPDLNKYINLKNRVEARMALVDIAATFEDNILDAQAFERTVEQLELIVKDDLKYRDRQLLRLRDEILDLEELNENISLCEFTLDDFRIDLANYLEANRKALQEAPFGLYAVVPPHPDFTAIQPGVIFCLKHREAPQSGEQVNPLQPYYLVYMRDDGNARFTFAQPKQILECFRHLCAGKTEAYGRLCDWFDVETQNGGYMRRYSDLAKRAAMSIGKTFKRRAVNPLQHDRGAVLMIQQEQVADDTDFELITWLVISDGEA